MRRDVCSKNNRASNSSPDEESQKLGLREIQAGLASLIPGNVALFGRPEHIVDFLDSVH